MLPDSLIECFHPLLVLRFGINAALAFGGATAVLVSAEGQVKYETEKKSHGFTQQFVLLQQDGVWKIASDCFRFIG